MSRTYWWGLFGVLVIGGGGAWFGLSTWRSNVIEKQRERAHAGVALLVQEERWLEARGAIQEFMRAHGSELSPTAKNEWRRLDALASAGAGDLARLVWLEQQAPEILATMEEPSLKIYRSLAAAGRDDEAARVRAQWRGREVHPHYWLAAEVDQLLARGEPESAVALLQATKFEGAADAGRLMRLAMLARTPAESWELLNQAVVADVRNPDARSFRGQILERLGDVGDARTEFVAALVADPADPVRRDQLAQFYVRRGALAPALQTWREGMSPSGADFLWLRVLFWQRLAGGNGDPLPDPPLGAWTSLIQAMSALVPGQFWDEKAMLDPNEQRKFAQRPEVAVLRLLEALRRSEEVNAREHSATLSGPARSIDPVAIAALQAVLRWRATELAPQFGDLPPAPPGRVEHVLIEQIRMWRADGLPAETEALLTGPDAWSALMLAAGWPEAALVMAGDRLQNPVAGAPEWFYYGMTVALRQRRDDAAAQSFLARCPSSSGLALLAAEMTWLAGREDAAREAMAKVAATPGGAGNRAAWLLASDAYARGQWAEARRWVESRQDLSESIGGQEILARSWASEGDLVKATRIYEILGPRSLEAGLLLARRAFEANNFAQARELIEVLMAGFPDRIELRGTLEEVIQAEQAAAAAAPEQVAP